MRTWLLLGIGIVSAAPGLAQQPTILEGRWVGTHNHSPLHLDFYGDTMVVVNDRWALDYRATFDSLIVWGRQAGDTSFAVRYWFSLDRLLLQTDEGKTITMTRQDELARPIDGRWQGSLAGRAGTDVVLRMLRGGSAERRIVPGGEWVRGEWERRSRIIRFTWLPDSSVWIAHYDPQGEALLFDSTEAGIGTLILRKVYR